MIPINPENSNKKNIKTENGEQIQIEQHKKFISEIFEKNSTSPIKFNSIIVDGGQHVRSEVLQKYIYSIFSNATTFKQLCESSDLLAKKLIEHGLVENISQTFDSRGTYTYPMIKHYFPSKVYDSKHIPKDLSVIDIISHIKVLPLKRFMAKTGTNIGNGEGDGYLQFQLRNIFGGGEQLKFDVTKGTKTHSSYLLNYVQPLTPWWIWDSIIYKNDRELGSTLEMGLCGIRSSLKGKTDKNEMLKQEIFIEGITRKTKLIESNSSDSLLFQAGHDSKLSIGHTIAWDTRDNLVTPSKGNLLKLSNELAYNSFSKTQLEASCSNSWFKDNFLTLSSTIRAGYISNISGGSKQLHISDKFQLGGGNDIRSFRLMGLGPKDIYDSIGGNAFCVYGVSVFSRLPFKKLESSNFRLHFFFNGGKLINHNSSSVKNLFDSLTKENSLSTGFGLIFIHPVARFELNFSLPVTAHSSDSIRKGFQYGVGMSFL